MTPDPYAMAVVSESMSAPTPQGFAPFTATVMEHPDGRFSALVVDSQGAAKYESYRRYSCKLSALEDGLRVRRKMLLARAREM